MRVLHVLPTRDAEYGGPIRVAEAFCAQLRREGHEGEVFAPSVSARSAAKRLAYWPGLGGLRALHAKICTVDLVHVHGLWTLPASVAAACARALSLPFVITPHGMLDRWSLQHHGLRKKVYAAVLERRNLEHAAALHFFNEEEREEARAFGIRVPTFLLPNGVDLEQFLGLPARQALWQRYPVTAHRTVVLFLGRLHPKKGLPILIAALARIASRRPEVMLVIAGPDEGAHRAEIEAAVARHGLDQRVLFTGPAYGDDKRLLLGGADVFVLPSHQEGDSVAVKEALAAGLPVVITHPCHFPQVAEAGAGLVVDPAEEEVAEALEHLCGDERARRQMAQRARPLIERRYRWEVLGRELLGHYQEVLARHRAPESLAAEGGG